MLTEIASHHASQSAVSTALPTIINHFQGQQFVWIGSAYTLAGVAFLPLSGHFANLFGRRPILLIGLALFAVGSALCGAASSMGMLIAGRSKYPSISAQRGRLLTPECLLVVHAAVQGLGSGVILALTEIILADLVPLRERGAYQGAIGLIWSIASIIGPLVVCPTPTRTCRNLTPGMLGRCLRCTDGLDMAWTIL